MTRSYLLTVLILTMASLNSCRSNLGERSNVLKPGREAELMIMDFRYPPGLDPIQAGWAHRKFFWHSPMKIEFVEKEGIPAVKLSTHDTASMLMRHVEIPLNEYPTLKWSWLVEQPISSPLDEETTEGDDHPARFFTAFETETGERRAMEIIWGNRLRAGQY